MSAAEPPTAGQMSAWLAESPFHRVLGLTLESCDAAAQTVVIRCAFHSDLDRSAAAGQYHGGVIASLIDVAGDFALIAVLGHGVPTINFRVDYLRPAMKGDLIARATVRKAGRTIGVVDIEVQDDRQRLIALGRGCYGTQPG
ncbi:MAG TPA: PaaI family thioesterase [Steroidobacteraceae bacterium]|nr:PaaI family thioesterase [Steroidobacteraceae bacterium]